MRKINQWKIYTIVMSIVSLALGVALSVSNTLGQRRENDYINQLENGYNMSYYNLMYALETIDISLQKLEVSGSAPYQMELLDKISSSSELAEVSLMSLTNGDMSTMSKYMNQMGDYSRYLMKKLIYNDSISDSDYESLKSMQNNASIYYNNLSNIQEEIAMGNFSFIKALKDTDSSIAQAYDALTSDENQYPSLIYDGPFSDGIDEITPKELSGVEFNKDTGSEQAKAYIKNEHDVESITYSSTGEGNFNSLNYDFKLKNGDTGSIQITAVGGLLHSMNISTDVKEKKVSEEDCIQHGIDYLTSLGITDMKGVWVSFSSNKYYINYVTEKNDTIIYPELIKLVISADDGKVIGAESHSFIYSYESNRAVENPDISEDEVRANIKSGFSIEEVRLAIIPTPNKKEKLVYEVYGKYDDKEYFIYVDAKTGHEIDILKVIDGDNGRILL